MTTKQEGFNTFSNYETNKYYLDFNKRGRQTSTVQLRFGGFAKTEEENVATQVRKYNRLIGQYFHSRVKDGYFKKKFFHIKLENSLLEKKGEGLFWTEIFFFLEETYDKTFVIDYFKTIFPDIEQINKTNKSFKFQKYAKKQGQRRQESSQQES